MKKFNLVVAPLIFFAGTLMAQAHVGAHHHREKPNALSRYAFHNGRNHKTGKVKHITDATGINHNDPTQIAVQVTAYAPSSHAMFANGKRVNHANALVHRNLNRSVQMPTLPEGEVVYAALSSRVQRRLHANLNDYFVIVHRQSHQSTIVKFVDLVSSAERRPVVDLYFANAHQASLWGRQTGYYAVNLSDFRVLD